MPIDAVPANEVQAIVEEKGMLAKKLYIVTTFAVNGLDKVLEMIEPHIEYQVELERRGIMFGAGPNWTEDETEWRGEGTVIIRAQSFNEACEIMEADPMHSSGARKFTIRPWLMNEGHLSFTLDFSSGKFKFK